VIFFDLKMKKKELVKKASVGLILLIITLLTFKFIMWNWWKVEGAVKLAKGILKAPSAVNLTILQENSILFQKSFPYNHKGNYYIVNHFDITPYLSDYSTIFELNGQKAASIVWYRFKTFNIVDVQNHYFLFTTDDRNRGIETFLEVKNSMPNTIRSLFKLALYGEEDKKELIYSLLTNSQKELKYGAGMFSSEMPVPFEKGKIYEIVFDYKVIGPAVPTVIVAPNPYLPENILARHVLDNSLQHTYRKCCITFRSKSHCPSSLLYLLKRSRKRHDRIDRIGGIVYFRNISLYLYENEYQGLGQLTGSGAACLDFINKIKSEFIEVSYIKN
jgi:hypothetical protein